MQCLVLLDTRYIRLNNPRNFVIIVSCLMMTYSAPANITQLLISALIFLMVFFMAFKGLLHLSFYWGGMVYNGRDALLPRFIMLHSSANHFGNKLGYQYINNATLISDWNHGFHRNGILKHFSLKKYFKCICTIKKRLPILCIKNIIYPKQLLNRSRIIRERITNTYNFSI